ncbi:c-type cytochrome [Ketogulonicigenium vulgare]|uniref:Cytochrome c family protein n=1 Tax=Ketogulonicigenium vulgare (strain WSH-001) TaxID=759362 RepID=F9Y9W0_KETVW|nr:c-type cytochrome [Ketogulonicigenium vulgare]ADO41992.1 cytochrome c family protein [Ketogulonicigenium vulgare Y25]AEM40212.1 cytochrome c family protein [Ketogulonicigenium vulgare WSH-001]ALJ80414.1 cytochrome C [Ketogulonicigenium vulgare]ANW33244.1 cytochrome C [Ketogulonicigenium vulgare]AOZ53916.1 cytochrome C family protein [Ketogulonicigenium vulgare]
MNSTSIPLVAALALVPLIAACAAFMPEREFDGAQMFAQNCAACHGADGTGSRAMGIAMEPPATDLTRIATRNGGTFPWNSVMSTIDGFGQGGHNGAMPAFGDGDLGEPVLIENNGVSTPVPAGLLAVANYVYGLQK